MAQTLLLVQLLLQAVEEVEQEMMHHYQQMAQMEALVAAVEAVGVHHMAQAYQGREIMVVLRLTFMVQEEVAQRLVVKRAGAADAREMSQRVRFYAPAARYVRFVPRASFEPPPRVDSAIVRLPLEPPERWPLPRAHAVLSRARRSCARPAEHV